MKKRGKILLVLACFSICGTAALVSRYLSTEREQTRPAELYSVITRQVEALQRDDFSGAYQEVALETQQRFTLDQFSTLIRTNYPTLTQAQRLEFGRVEMHGTHAYIQVFFFSRQGVQPSIYQLNNDRKGWKIVGARLLRRAPQSPLLHGVQA